MLRRRVNDQETQEVNEEVETLNFEKPSFSFIPKGFHTYKQQGFYLVCNSCDIQHATWIGSEKLMVGIQEDGQPILKDRNSL